MIDDAEEEVVDMTENTNEFTIKTCSNGVVIRVKYFDESAGKWLIKDYVCKKREEVLAILEDVILMEMDGGDEDGCIEK